MALDPKTWGTYYLLGKTGNSDKKIKASENMGCNLRRCNSSTLFGMFS